MVKIKNLKLKLIVIAALIIYAAVLMIFEIPCPIYSVFGIECLGCGMTRALISALKFDFFAAFQYHKMFWSLPILFVAFLRDGSIFKNKVWNILLYAVLLIGYVYNWAVQFL